MKKVEPKLSVFIICSYRNFHDRKKYFEIIESFILSAQYAVIMTKIYLELIILKIYFLHYSTSNKLFTFKINFNNLIDTKKFSIENWRISFI